MKLFLLVIIVAFFSVGAARGSATVFRPSLVGRVRSIDAQVPSFTIKWFNQTLDHFSFATVPQNFKQRYIWSDVFWSRHPDAPIIFYSGNEGDIFMFFNNTGFAFDLAKQFGALVIFAEHRYYGQSLPFGSDSFKPKNLQYLAVEQALADYAVLLTEIKKNESLLQNSPVLTIGGSYGGFLSAFFRIKYPHIVAGALASSAPILQFRPYTSDYRFFQIVTQDYTDVDPACSDIIRQSFKYLVAMGAAGRFDELSRTFSTCSPIKDANGFAGLIEYLKNSFLYMAMTDYAYPTSFLTPLPAWPVNTTCAAILANPNAADPLTVLKIAANIFYNSTGTQKCAQAGDFSFIDPETATSWTYQVCTEIQLNAGTNGVTDMFPPKPYDLDELKKLCQTKFGVTPRPGWITTWFGGPNITDSSNIIFANGKLDPCWGGSILSDLSPSLIAVNIDQGAHHSDLRAADPRDPPSVVQARATEFSIISNWFNAYYKAHNLRMKL